MRPTRGELRTALWGILILKDRGEEEEPVEDTESDWGGRRKIRSYVLEAK